MNAIALNNENAKLLINLLERLPMDIYSDIMEFNSEHRAKMNVVLSQMIRYVYCPSYYHAAEDEIYSQRHLIVQNVSQLNSMFSCPNCGKSRETDDVFSQIYYERFDAWVSEEISFCTECYENENDIGNSSQDDDFIASVGWDGRGIAPWDH